MILKHILLIEDDLLLIDNISELLSLNNFLVTTCMDGKIAIELIKNNNTYDLIICDMLLPNYSGLEILKFVRNTVRNLQLPFIFLSAKAELSDIRSGMDLGADDYLTKPFNIKDLLHLINLRLNKKASDDNRLYDQLKLRLNEIPKILSHEINTPMNGIVGLTSLMLNNYSSFNEEDFKKSLTSIIISCERLQDTQKKFFSFFELLNEHEPGNDQKILLNNLVETLQFQVNLFNEKEQHKLHRINLDLGENIKESDLEAKIDVANFIKITKELLDNSVKYSIKDSKIQLNLHIIDQKLVLSITNIAHDLNSVNFNLNEGFMDEKRSLHGRQGFGLGLLLIQKICKLYNADFNFLILDNNITFYVKFKFI